MKDLIKAAELKKIFAISMITALVFVAFGLSDCPAMAAGKGQVREVEAKSAVLPDHMGRTQVRIKGDFVYIPPGKFIMGSPESEEDRDKGETPHEVELTQGIYMARHAVTQEQYFQVMGKNPSRFRGKEHSDGDYKVVNKVEMNTRHPVESVNYGEAAAYLNALSERDGFEPVYRIIREDGNIIGAEEAVPDIYKARGWRLPTEAEWERAARAGTRTPNYFPVEQMDEHAWHHGNSGGRTHAVGLKKGNAWGLYDMSGNVWEWAHDGYAPHYNGPMTNPKGTGPYRVVRGGSWNDYVGGLRSALRYGDDPRAAYDTLGFRAVRSVVDP